MPKKKQQKKQNNNNKSTIIIAIMTVIIITIVGICVVPHSAKIDLDEVIRKCGYSSYNKNDAAYIYYDKNQDAIAINASMLWVYLFSTAAENDFDFSDPPKALCPLDEIGLLNNKQFLSDFVTRLDENRSAGYSGTYSGDDGKRFTITYNPNEEINVQSDITKIDVNFKGKLYIKQKLTLF